MKKIVLYTCLIVFQLCALGQSETKTSLEIQNERLKMLIDQQKEQIQQQKTYIEKLEKSNDKMIENKMLENKNKYENEVLKFTKDLATPLTIGIAVFIAIVGMVGYNLFTLKGKVASYFDVHISKTVEKQKELITSMMNEKDLDNKIKKELKIGIVYSQNPNQELMNTLNLQKFQFKAIQIGQSNNLKDYDLVFIDNSDNSFNYTQEDVSGRKSYVTPQILNGLYGKFDNQEATFFYFTDSQAQETYRFQTRAVGFANSLSTINHNLLDVMRYKYCVIDRRV